MLHFFPHYANDVSEHPFAVELRRCQLPHRFFASEVDRNYTTLAERLFVAYPRMMWVALGSAIRSLLLSRPRPVAAVVGSDIEALIFGLIRTLLRLRTIIVYETLIIAPRRSPVLRAATHGYFGFILSLIDVAICHSRAETVQYAAAFPRARCRFACVPYGTTVTNHRAVIAKYRNRTETADIVTAGRSGRDYTTLAKAIEGLPCRLRIICNLASSVAGITQNEQITVIRDCFGGDYIDMLAKSLFVVVPLAADDVSAGQMVLLQASALRKAVVVTRTTTTLEYATDTEDALFVDIGDVQQMRTAIRRLLEDTSLRDRLAENALGRFERCYTTEQYVRNMVAAIVTVARPGKADALRHGSEY
ncbi:glycosyltransferase [Rhodopila sp.]|uniref:glycosyltransferase n=1 Tax=Rhodopila sp. TaxID=2480087 RepID=UPI003D09B3AA